MLPRDILREVSLSALTCSNCTAPLDADDDGDGVIRCAYCGRAHRFANPPPPPSVHKHPKGSPVVVEWSGRWWDAHVIDQVGPDRWHIRYDGWSEKWNEVVGPDRIRDRATARARSYPRATATRNGALVVLAVFALVVGLTVAAILALGSRATSRPTGSVATTESALAPGQAVEVYWQGRWFPADVVAVHADGRVRVHYTGYADSWDEDVTRDRVRVPAE